MEGRQQAAYNFVEEMSYQVIEIFAMANRTALFICCSALEAKIIRQQARAERRTVSSYVLYIVFRVLPFEERIFMVQNNRRPRSRLIGPRTAVLVRCSIAEANRIRAAAARSGTTISTFVVMHLRRWWAAGRIPIASRV